MNHDIIDLVSTLLLEKKKKTKLQETSSSLEKYNRDEKTPKMEKPVKETGEWN